jgi:hypothetical protein
LKGPQLELRADLVGCYALFVGGRPLDSTYYESSPRVLLDSMPLTGRGPIRMLRRLDLTGRMRDPLERPFTSWVVDSVTGILRLSFHNGLSGAVLSLRDKKGSDTLEGRIANYWDFGPGVSDRGRVRAIRVPCV